VHALEFTKWATWTKFQQIIQPCTKQMGDRPRLVQISCGKNDSPNRFSKGTVKEEVLDSLIPIIADTFLPTFPIFTSQIVFVRTTSLCRN
jgi:hypothetical protein